MVMTEQHFHFFAFIFINWNFFQMHLLKMKLIRFKIAFYNSHREVSACRDYFNPACSDHTGNHKLLWAQKLTEDFLALW